jgi:hypothetical protein
MLRTGGSASSREKYADEAGACVIIPGRLPSDRVPFGFVEYIVHYKFAGRVQPGVALNKPLPEPKQFSVDQLTQMLSDAVINEQP